MANSMSDRINALKIEAGEHGDTEQVEMCERAIGHALVDSDSGDRLSIDQLGGTIEYVRAICESLDCREAEGHVRVLSYSTDDHGRLLTSRRVYAQL